MNPAQKQDAELIPLGSSKSAPAYLARAFEDELYARWSKEIGHRPKVEQCEFELQEPEKPRGHTRYGSEEWERLRAQRLADVTDEWQRTRHFENLWGVSQTWAANHLKRFVKAGEVETQEFINGKKQRLVYWRLAGSTKPASADLTPAMTRGSYLNQLSKTEWKSAAQVAKEMGVSRKAVTQAFSNLRKRTDKVEIKVVRPRRKMMFRAKG